MGAGFENYLSAQGLAVKTVYVLCRTFVWIQNDLKEITTESVEAYIVKEQKRGIGNAQINKYLQCLRHYIAWKDLKGIKIPKSFREHNRSPQTFSDTEIEQIIGFKKNRYTSFLALLAYTGMRPGEAVKLTNQDIDATLQTISIVDTKTYSDRIIPISEPLQKHLVGFRSFDFSLDSVRLELKKRCELLNIDKTNRSLYSLRHSFITRLVDSDLNLLVVKSLAGTQSKAIERYYHSNLKKLRSAVNSDRLVIEHMKAADVLRAFLQFVRQFPFGNKVSVSISESEDEVVIRVKKKTN